MVFVSSTFSLMHDKL